MGTADVVTARVLGLLAAVVLVAGCGDPGESTPGGSEPASPSASEQSTELTVRGTVSPGVEPGCLVLHADGTQYLLLGGGDVVRPGADLVVRGRPEPDRVTTCQQGTPFMVVEAQLAGQSRVKE